MKGENNLDKIAAIVMLLIVITAGQGNSTNLP